MFITPVLLLLPGKEGTGDWGLGPGQAGPQNSGAGSVGSGGGWPGVKRPACLLGANDEEFGEAVACLLLGPDVFVAFVLTGVLKQQWKGG